MLGAIAGDVIGSVYEFANTREYGFKLFTAGSDFTDDTVLTVAVAQAILKGQDYGPLIKHFARAYPGRGYGGMFTRWIRTLEAAPYNSLGNGSAMRVSPVGFAFNTEAEVLQEAKRSAEVTHDHPEGVKGAQAVALAIFLARNKKDKESIRTEIASRFGYDLGRTLDQIRPGYGFDATCPGSVPEAVTAFLESDGFEDAIRKAVSLGGDSDTIACIAGGIAQAFYGGVPAGIAREVRRRLPEEMLAILDAFNARFGPGPV